jgi:peptide/nickel transport system substrate-binding protein
MPNDQYSEKRRELIKAALGGGTVLLAGCSGDGNNDGGTPTNDGGDGSGGTQRAAPQMTDQVFRFTQDVSFQDLQFNLANNATADVEVFNALIQEPLLKYDRNNGQILNTLLSDVSVDGETMTITVADGFTWHNGDPVTADDLLTNMKLGAYFGATRRSPNTSGVFESTDALSKPDEMTVEGIMKRAYNPTLATQLLFLRGGFQDSYLWAPHAVFSRFVESYEDATTDDERSAVTSEYTGFRWELEEAYGSGLWQLDSRSGDEITLELHEGHPQAGELNFSSLRGRNIPKDQYVPILRSNGLDTLQVESEIGELPDNWFSEGKALAGGVALMPNHEHEIFGQTEVRQALAHIVNTEEISQNHSEAVSNPVPPTYSGFPGSNIDRYIGSELRGQMITYNSLDEAERLLESVDFTKEDGEWFKPNGERWEPTVRSWTTPAWQTTTQTVVGQLERFGIGAEAQIMESSAFFADYPNGAFPIATEWWGAQQTPSPLFAYERDMVGFGGSSMQYPAEVEAPPVGEPDGSLQTYVIDDVLSEPLTAENEEARMEGIRKLAWIRNYTLPNIPMMEMVSLNLFNTNRFSWPSEDHPGYQMGGGPWWMLRNGDVTANPQ